MNCPKCQHDVELHEVGGCYHGEPLDKDHINYCDCELTHAQALLAAQRHAAAERLLWYRSEVNFHRDISQRAWSIARKKVTPKYIVQEAMEAYNFHRPIFLERRAMRAAYQQALRDVGVQRPRTVKK